LQVGLPPACAQACPTQSIKFGPLTQLKKDATARVAQLHRRGETKARLYGADDAVLGGLNSFLLLLHKPETYGPPAHPHVPTRPALGSTFWSIFTGLLVTLGVLFRFRTRRRPDEQQAGEMVGLSIEGGPPANPTSGG